MSKHIPVMLHEAINALDIISNGFYIDCTFGRGGHSKEILKKLNDDGRLLALDKDLEAVKEGETIIDKKPVSGQESKKSVGDYVDFEEID